MQGSGGTLRSLAEPTKRRQSAVPEKSPRACRTALSGVGLALLATCSLAGFSLLPTLRSSPGLSHAFWTASGALFLALLSLAWRAARDGRHLVYEWAPRKVHYVQLLMHSSVYLYWGWYWREVYRYAPLIAAQIVFAYVLEMTFCWWRRDKWVAGFGPFPIVLSTNLFLWFREDWFFLQFLLIACALASKQFLRWKRDGRLTHIFNPSAFGLFVLSVSLLASHATQLSRAGEIAFTLSYPPHIYLEIFIIGMIVQALFSVTLVTLSSVAALWLLNLGYTQWTGLHQFGDSNIPVLVFLGAHLLVTDPATSPRTGAGKIIFGGLYGASVFALRGVLGSFGVPLFYDKLLCVPALNLAVPVIDRIGTAMERCFRARNLGWKLRPAYANPLHMGVWVMVFVTMQASGFLGYTDTNPDSESWRLGCLHGRGSDCLAWLRELHADCEASSGVACFTLGRVLADGRAVPGDAVTAAESLDRACQLGYTSACTPN